MKTIICFWGCLLVAFACNAQSAVALFSSIGGQAEYTTPTALGYDINSDSVSYSECKGSPFWKDDFNPAILVLKNGKAVRLDNVRLDLYTNQIRYQLYQGPELVAKAGTVKRVIFLDRMDTTKVTGAFESFEDIGRLQNKKDAPFCQVLTFGKVQFVKSYAVTMDSKLDYLLGKPTTTISRQVSYYLVRDNIFYSLKKLNKEDVLSFVITNTDTNNWLAAKKNKLKTETDIIGFLDYYNGVQ